MPRMIEDNAILSCFKCRYYLMLENISQSNLWISWSSPVHECNIEIKELWILRYYGTSDHDLSWFSSDNCPEGTKFDECTQINNFMQIAANC